MIYELYGLPHTRMNRVTWMLEEVGARYELHHMMPHSAQAKAMNPSGKIPVLKTGAFTLADSIAICLYLADAHPEKMLNFKCGSPYRAQLNSWLQFASTEMEDSLWMFMRHATLLPEEKRIPEILPFCRSEFGRMIKVMEERLGEGPYLFGERFTIADLNFGFLANWAEAMDFEIPSGRVKGYFDLVRKRRALVRAFRREEEMRSQTC